MFKALVIDKDDSGHKVSLKEVDGSFLPEGDVLVDVEYSSMNYKDALAITGKAPIVKSFPMIPGIDLVGRVAETDSPFYEKGQYVVLTGWGVGEKHCGGFAKKARLKSDWLVHLPEIFTPKQAMAIGTAGFTAMLCVLALEEQNITPDSGDILVTGASGGVGSVAISVLSKLGYRVIALPGADGEEEYLKGLGADEVMEPGALSEPGKPLAKEKWAGAVDVVGSTTLANVCAGVRYNGAVAACGLAGGMDFPSTVAPFILRGVTLSGVDSVMCPREKRLVAWERLAKDLDLKKLSTIMKEIALEDAIPFAEKLIEGSVQGRMLVKV